ncbi:MAG: hypothetical protein ACREFE_09050 [Limisphaerales bacterium]
MARAQIPVTLTIDSRIPSHVHVIPADFSGLSFGAVTELPGHGRVSGYLFCATNIQLITLFKNSGLHHLRLGGSTVDGTNIAFPNHVAIDNVFAFAKGAGVKVIYSLRLLNGNSMTDADTAQYIWEHYRPLLDYFAIGNEPDIRRYHYPPFGTGTDPSITNYTSYLTDWRKFAATIIGSVPDAKFAAPDAAGKYWAQLFAKDEKNSGIIALITQHYYVGGKRDNTTATQAIDNMLSADWVTARYSSLYKNTLASIVSDGLPYRLTESDDYLKGIANASDSFASALWALDYMHWWAAHGCDGVNFHNTEWLKTDTIYLDSSGNYRINPKAYGIKAFDLGGHGYVESVTIANKKALNLTAYAVRDAANLYVTIINKEHGNGARDAIATIIPNSFLFGNAAAMFLTAPNGDVAATNGIMLGSASIANNVRWHGQWTPLDSATNGQCLVAVPSASAAVVKISAR